MPYKILIADDDKNVLSGLDFLLTEEGYQVIEANTPNQVKDILLSQSVDLLLTDMNFHRDTTSGQEGLEVIRNSLQAVTDLPIVVMTGWATIDIAVAALKAGAKDFVQKPWNDDHLLATISTQLQLATVKHKADSLAQHNRILQQEAFPQARADIVAQSNEMQNLLATLEDLAQSDMNILLTGDNGTGKSMLAQFIHRASARNNADFVSVNMGAIPENLFESELFGHNKGAFTDAKENRIGRFEMAQAGTLFLDELANIPLSQQAKLLRVLEERKFERVGSSRTIDANVRIVSATNADLSSMIADGSFRQDLYYRLNTVELRVPSLAERRADIMPLAEYFLQQHCQKYNKAMPKLTEDATKSMQAYHWPGNIRELSHLMERILFTCKDASIDVKQLNLNNTTNTFSQGSFDDATSTLEAIEKSVLVSRLALYKGNVTETAKSLGLSRSGYYRRAQKFGLD